VTATSWSDVPYHLLNLAIAFVLGLPIGWNREREERSAGLRTFTLVAVASCGYLIATQKLLVQNPQAQARVIEGLITGIGFIGSGAILKQGANVHGTATAASIWATGAIGVAVALGQYDIAAVLSGTTFALLRWLVPLTGSRQQESGSDG
jgi:putative Mg2+ transporter-C (MgtC) family protein